MEKKNRIVNNIKQFLFSVLWPVLIFITELIIDLLLGFNHFMYENKELRFFVTNLLISLFLISFIIYKKRKNKLSCKFLNAFSVMRLCSIAMFLYSLTNIITYILIILSPPEISNSYDVGNDIKHLPILISFMSYTIFPPLIEEMVFRYGIEGNLLKIKFNNKKLQKVMVLFIIVIQAIIFALMHGHMYQVLYAFICGIVLGSIFAFEKNIMCNIVVHGFFNLIPILTTKLPTVAIVLLNIIALIILIFILFNRGKWRYLESV